MPVETSIAPLDDIEIVRRWLDGVVDARKTRALKSSPHLATVAKLYPDVEDAGEIAYMFVRGIAARPVCARCGGTVSWFGNRYATTCSKRCSNLLHDTAAKSQLVQKTRRQTEVGFEDRRTTARLKTMNEKYGANVGPQHRAKKPETWETLNRKGRITLQDRHGVTNPGQIPDHAAKLVQTSLNRHGLPHHTHTQESVTGRTERRRSKIASLLPGKIALDGIIPPNRAEGQANVRYVLRCTCGWVGELPSETFKFRLRTMQDVCTTCTGISSARSVKERNLYEFIKTIYKGPIDANDRSTIKVLKTGNKSTRLEIDILLPDLKIGFEFSGLFWHSTNDPSDEKMRNYHRNKHLAASMAGVRLVTIFEDEWDFRRPIVEHRLRSMLGAAPEKLFARKCDIRSITAKEARTFCERYHIQGYTPATHKYGMFFDNALVAVMTFSRPTIAKGKRGAGKNEWELSRFCSSTNVVGGASRLFKHFIRTENPLSILTYSDLRWNTGTVYNMLGFVSLGISRPNYWYIEERRRVNRFALRKTLGDDPTLTEFENRAAQGWRWIWDCGNARYIWRAPAE